MIFVPAFERRECRAAALSRLRVAEPEASADAQERQKLAKALFAALFERRERAVAAQARLAQLFPVLLPG